MGGAPTNYRRRRDNQQKSATVALTNCRWRRRGRRTALPLSAQAYTLGPSGRAPIIQKCPCSHQLLLPFPNIMVCPAIFWFLPIFLASLRQCLNDPYVPVLSFSVRRRHHAVPLERPVSSRLVARAAS